MIAPQKPKEDRAQTGMDDFWKVLNQYGRALKWGLGAAVVPIAAGLASLAPPWPPAIMQITALLELVILFTVFQILHSSQKTIINRVIVSASFVLAIFSLLYLFGISLFTYEEPLSKLRYVKGFICTGEALTIFPNKCPFYGDYELRQVEWEASALWVEWSITLLRVALVAFWSLAFGAFATCLGAFVVYQSGVRSQPPS